MNNKWFSICENWLPLLYNEQWVILDLWKSTASIEPYGIGVICLGHFDNKYEYTGAQSFH